MQEQKVLDRLKIKNFREINKNQVIELCSILDKVKPEVAKSIINQIPHFTSLMKQLSSDLRQITNDSLTENGNSMNNIYSSANKVLDSIDFLLRQESISEESKLKLVDKQIKVLDMLNSKDSENKGFIKLICEFCQDNRSLILGVTGIGISGIVAKRFFRKN